jgi:tetratricopeptide (TPR) repeat protein
LEEVDHLMLKLPSMILVILLSCAVLSVWSQQTSQQEAIQQALKFYISKVRSDPEDLALHRELMDMFSERGLIGIPIGIYADSAERNPTNPTVLYVLGYAYLMQGLTDPSPFGGYLLLNVKKSGGRTALQMSIVDALPYSPMDMAEKYLEAALKEKPRFPDALAALGDYYLKMEQRDLATEKWEEAIRIDDRCEPAHLSLARFYRSQKEYGKAVEEYQKTISLNPKRVSRRYLELGLTYFDMENLDRAEHAFLKAKKYERELAMAYYKLGQVYAKRGDRDEAVKIYREGRKYDPNNAEVAYELAHIFLDTGDTRYALLSMERGLSAEAVDARLSEELMAHIEKGTIAAANFMDQLSNFEYSDNFHLHYFLGKLYLKLGDNDDSSRGMGDFPHAALRHFRSAAGLSPSNADVRYQLGLLQEKLEPEKAKEQYQAAAELGTAEADPLFKAAQAYLEEGNEGKFIETAQRALTIDPNRADVHLQLAGIFQKRADIYRNNGQKEQEDKALTEAVKHYEQATTLRPDAQKWYNLGLLYERQGNIKAVRAYDKAIQLDPSFARAYYRRGDFRLSFKVGRASVLMYQPKVAVEDLKKAIELDPELAEAHFSLGMAYHQMDMQELATAEFAKTVEIDPDNVKAHIYLAQDYAAAGEHQKVIEHLSKAAELDDSNAEVLKNLGAMLLKHGGDAGVKPAQEALKKALELKPDDPEILMNYAYTLYLDRMFSSAIERYKKALEIRPDYPEANYNLALAYMGVREYQLALQHFEKVIELAPQSELASKAAGYVQKIKES